MKLIGSNCAGVICGFALYEIYDTIASRIKEKYMAKACPINNKSSQMQGGYSNRTRATQFNPTGNVRKYANLQKKRVYIPELKKSMTLTLSTKGIKTIQKNGAFVTLKKAGLI